MKKKLAIVAVLVIAAAAAFLMLQNTLGRLVKLAVEEFGSGMTQAAVRVGTRSRFRQVMQWLATVFRVAWQ